jgi:peptidoglycan/LPS O-acetylase OafA/YrhL
MNTKGNTLVLPLTSLRFFLATWIVVFHLNVILREEQNASASLVSPLMNTIFCAYVAVGVFFVLSGFILALNYRPMGRWNDSMRKTFAVARFSRVYPVYLLAFGAISPIIVSATLLGHSWSLLLRRLGSGILNVLMLQAWIPQAALSWNGPGWSLSNEAFFYLLFPLIGGIFFRASSLRQAAAILSILWILALLPPVVTIIQGSPGFGDLAAIEDPASPVASFVCFNPLLNLPLFLAGIVACRVFLLLQASGNLLGKGYLIYVPGIAFLLALTSFGNHIPYPLMHNGLMLPAALAIIIGLALGDRYLCAILSSRVLVFLGKASYAEYLLHFPIRAVFEWLGASWSALEQMVYLLAVIVLSALVYQFYERPLQVKLRDLLLRRTESGMESVASATSQ